MILRNVPPRPARLQATRPGDRPTLLRLLTMLGVLTATLSLLSFGQTIDTWMKIVGPLFERDSHGGGVEVRAFRDEVIIVSVLQGPFDNRHALARWNPPRGVEVVDVALKWGRQQQHVALILLSNGDLFYWRRSEEGPYEFVRGGTAPSGYFWNQVIGDAVYTVSSTGGVFVTRNEGASWQVDTLGLNGAFVNHLAVDTSQFVYAATKAGLFKQHPDSSIWHRIDSLYAGPFGQRFHPELGRVHVDRRNVVYANSAYRGTYVSTSGDAQWILRNDASLMSSVYAFGDDAFGNIYAISGGTDAGIYRSSDSGLTWIRIDGTLQGYKLDARRMLPFVNLHCDSLIALGTIYGVALSTDMGESWIDANGGIPFVRQFTLFRSGFRTLTSTENGLYFRDLGDTAWTRSFPTNGHLGGLIPQVDGSGNLYTTGESSQTSTTPQFYKSTDFGTSWIVDSVGQTRLTTGGLFFVDETGTQHYAVQTSIGFRKFSKAPSGTWELDTAGNRSVSTSHLANAIISDRSGSVYMAGKFPSGNMLRRPIGGGPWVVDTAGFGTRIPEKLFVDNGGNPIAIVAVESFRHAIFRRTGGVWTRLNHPLNGPSASQVSVDSSGVLWASFYNDPNNRLGVEEIRNRGVHFTTDFGTTWTKMGVDSTVVLGLVSFGDTTYALTKGRGIFAMTIEGVLSGVSADGPRVPGRFVLHPNYPNPFNPQTTIVFELDQRAHIELKVFNILGQEVMELVNGELEEGRHEKTFDAVLLPSGIYFYQLTSGAQSQTRKLVLVR